MDLTFEDFKECLTAVLGHHFDNHHYLGDWCVEQRKRIVLRRKQLFEFLMQAKEYSDRRHR